MNFHFYSIKSNLIPFSCCLSFFLFTEGEFSTVTDTNAKSNMLNLEKEEATQSSYLALTRFNNFWKEAKMECLKRRLL